MFVLTAASWQRVLLEYPAYEERLKGVAARYKQQRDAATRSSARRKEGREGRASSLLSFGEAPASARPQQTAQCAWLMQQESAASHI
jgi:hypothetical protein